MRYDNSQVRRQDRLLDEHRAKELLRDGEYGFLAMATDSGGYGVPINYVLRGDTIYLHCAPDGRKLRAIESDCRVSFCVVGAKHIIPHEFTTLYESVIAHGRARIVAEDTERREALRLLVEKYSPQYVETGLRAIERSLHRTAVVAIVCEGLTGKCKRM